MVPSSMMTTMMTTILISRIIVCLFIYFSRRLSVTELPAASFLEKLKLPYTSAVPLKYFFVFEHELSRNEVRRREAESQLTTNFSLINLLIIRGKEFMINFMDNSWEFMFAEGF